MINLPLYRFLIQSGASEEEAVPAAYIDTEHLVTKQDLAELKASLLMFTITVMVANTAITGLMLTLILWATHR